MLREHGMMAVPFSTPEFVANVKDDPSLLAWYLSDEPEGAGNGTAAGIKQAYEHLKAKDTNHPIGLDHYLFEALTTFKDACDFSMTDVYPITANRDVPVSHVGLFVDEARRIHGPNWPHWSYIQIFGGPDTDGGKWAQPLPHEVRCMTFDALVHRANAIMYFSYWPKAPATILRYWISRIEGKSSRPQVHVRARRVGESWMIIAVNLVHQPLDVTISVQGLGDAELRVPRDGRIVKATGGKLADRFAPFEATVYLVGAEPH